MSDYIKATNFAIKDSLPSGDPAKVVKGTEINTEFAAIESAIASKRDTTSTVPIANGGTGQTTASAAINALIPSQTGNSGKFLSTNGTAVSWAAASGNVGGPGSSTDNGVVLFDGTTGVVLKNSASQDGFIHGRRLGRGAGSVTTNTIFGANVLNSNTTGERQTVVGHEATFSNTSGSSTTAVGYASLYFQTTGSENTAIGDSALSNVTTGGQNTGVGYSALAGLTTGSENSGLGYLTTMGAGGRINCSLIGYSTAVTGDNQVQLGNASTTTYVYGTVQNRSDARDKADIRDTQLGLNFINALRPVDYKWDIREDYKGKPPKRSDYETEEAFNAAVQQWFNIDFNSLTNNGTHKRTRYHHGLVAQEVKQVLDAQGIDFGGYQDHSINGGADVLSIGYDELIAPLIKSVQELTARLEAAEATIQQLQGN